MPARVLTLVVSSVLACALVVAAVLLPVPYVSLGPGPIFNTLGKSTGTKLITIDGHPSYPGKGQLDVVTVSVSDRLSLGEVLRGWFDGDVAVVPRDLVFPPDETTEQVDQQNTEDMTQSQDAATVVALSALGITTDSVASVASVVAGSPAVGRLAKGDVITSVDGVPVSTAGDVVKAVSSHAPGEQVSLGITRDGTPKKVTITTAAAGSDSTRAMIGAQVTSRHDFPFTVKIQLDNVGGPSAGLMFSLGIYDMLTPGPLTGGKDVAGTGTIDDTGAVGPIGGIRQKLVGARHGGAHYFLVPKDNCAEAKLDPPAGLTLVEVTDFDGALAAVRKIGKGISTGLPTC